MATLLFVAFIVYLYVPYLVFKFFADLGIDIGNKRDSTKVEEFFGAAAPSLLLNGLAYVILRSLAATHLLRFPRTDWPVVASVFEDDKFPTLAKHFSALPVGEIRYLGALMLVAIVNGLIYGQVERRLLVSKHRAGFFWSLALLIRQIWVPFFGDQIFWFSAAAIQQTYAFVRTKDGNLFYGQIWGYSKSKTGELDGCSLVLVQRYSREKIEACVAKLKNPLRRLHGSLFLKWAEITDINFVEPHVMDSLRRKYAKQLRAEYLKRKEQRKAHADPAWGI